MGMLGSFWSRSVAEKTKNEVRAIATLAANAPALRRLVLPMQTLTNASVATVENVRVPFLDGDFLVVGPDLTNLWRTSLQLPDGTPLRILRRNLDSSTPISQVLLGANGRPLGRHNGFLLGVLAAEDEGFTGSETLYVLPLPDGLTPVVIATKTPDRVLVQGIDFETGPNHIILRESPSSLFFAGGFTVLIGLCKVRAPYDFLRQVNGHTYGSTFIAAYYKGSGSAASFERAAAQACGLLVTEVDDTLLAVQRLSPTAVRYVFLRAGVYDVGYPHEQLSPGTNYARGHIVSNGFRLVSGGAPGWLRRASGERALRVDAATAVPGSYLMPQLVTAYYVEVGSDAAAGGARLAIPHARVQLRASEQALLGLWSRQQNHEKHHGVFLADVIGLSPSAPKVAFDMHQVLENFYQARLLLLLPEFEAFPPSFALRLQEFVRRETPMGACVLVADDPPPDLEQAGAYQPQEALEGSISYVTGPDNPVPGGLFYDPYLLAYDGEVLAYIGV